MFSAPDAGGGGGERRAEPGADFTEAEAADH
jgi:hypothetical protein